MIMKGAMAPRKPRIRPPQAFSPLARAIIASIKAQSDTNQPMMTNMGMSALCCFTSIKSGFSCFVKKRTNRGADWQGLCFTMENN